MSEVCKKNINNFDSSITNSSKFFFGVKKLYQGFDKIFLYFQKLKKN